MSKQKILPFKFLNHYNLIVGGLILVIFVILIIPKPQSKPQYPLYPTSTGTSIPQVTPDPKQELIGQLQDSLPIQEDGFSITYDYDHDQFVINVQAPHDVNQTKFSQWRAANGFSQVPEAQIAYHFE